VLQQHNHTLQGHAHVGVGIIYIVKHGVKCTGVPAWPTQQRDDEVWAMVAFLRVLPDLRGEDCWRLVHGEAVPRPTVAPVHNLLQPEKAPQAVAESCARCQGVEGRGRDIAPFPRLAGQRPVYLRAALQAYARGERHSEMMEPIAADLIRKEMRDGALFDVALCYESSPR
jgi:cytochrome c553